ncbi:MAG: hypothetical protein HY957_00970 [Nitrospirae bacterium]|nr:hypothetical protein [Nitrospirota bacterium]
MIIVGDTQIKPVADAVKGIKDVLPFSVKAYAPSDVKNRLSSIIEKEDAKVVIALGRDAFESAFHLPETIPIIYGMVVSPPNVKRQNITGIYLETPVGEYISVINKFFPRIKKIGMVYSSGTERLLESTDYPHIKAYKAKDSYAFINALKSFGGMDALLLLPDRNFLSPTSMEEAYLFSFRNKIPILGISEKYVKDGAFFALVFDPQDIGRQIGETAKAVLAEGSASKVPVSSPAVFNLYINTDTAKKMNIQMPDEFIKRAKRVYP